MVVRALPGPHEPPGPGAPRGHRGRWWHEHVSAVGGVLLLVDPRVEQQAVRRAVEIVAVCGRERGEGATDPVAIAREVPHDVLVAVMPEFIVAKGAGATAVDAVRSVASLFRPG